MKKLTLLLSLLVLVIVLIGCSGEGEIKESEGSNPPEADIKDETKDETVKIFSDSTEFTEEESAQLELGENEKAVKLYFKMPPLVKYCLSSASSVDEFFESTVAESASNYTIPIVFDGEGNVAKICSDNKNAITEYVKGPQLEELYRAIFEPRCVLDTAISEDYTIDRVLFFGSNTTTGWSSSWTADYWILYETSKGDFVLFMSLYYVQNDIGMHLITIEDMECAIEDHLKRIVEERDWTIDVAISQLPSRTDWYFPYNKYKFDYPD
ncbi:MAG: hypothetical protein E7634_07605 [Ruminococcaceae bacterium]|nr:hypothetical protein [Oscillospiraceae bacterium]